MVSLLRSSLAILKTYLIFSRRPTTLEKGVVSSHDDRHLGRLCDRCFYDGEVHHTDTRKRHSDKSDFHEMDVLRNRVFAKRVVNKSDALHRHRAVSDPVPPLEKRLPPPTPVQFTNQFGMPTHGVGPGQSAYGVEGSLLGTVGLSSGIGVAAIAQWGIPCKVVAHIIPQNWQVQLSTLRDLLIINEATLQGLKIYISIPGSVSLTGQSSSSETTREIVRGLQVMCSEMVSISRSCVSSIFNFKGSGGELFVTKHNHVFKRRMSFVLS